MPFKAGKSPSDVSRKIQQVLTTGLDKDIEAGLFGMYTTLAGTADYYTPVDTTNLVQSRAERGARINKTGDGWRMTYGYYTDYAAILHETTDWKPKPPNTPGKPGGGYNPNARPNWMNLAWQEVGQDAIADFARILDK